MGAKVLNCYGHNKRLGGVQFLKVMSYTAYFFNRLITTQFPTISTYRRVVQFQMVLNALPIFMMIAKIILRSTARFHLDSESQEKKGNAPSGEKSHLTHSPQNDLIPLEVKATLDNLFGGPGSVDRLPVYKGDLNKVKDTMTDPIMKGIAYDSSNKESNPFIAIKMRCVSIAIKMRCVSGLEDVKKKFDIPSDHIRLFEKTLVLKPVLEDPLMWEQDNGGGIFPEFFKESTLKRANFTYAEDGQLTKGQTKGFELLQRLIKEGGGEDSNGSRWEIIGHKS